ncbi:MAG: helix-hairpin-helix domain-containing protein [Methylacidiphilales bacterium]|nr:helix-hairpin-helix domain-containing protein [Candidatus Methylacidiphilales bacterium]
MKNICNVLVVIMMLLLSPSYAVTTATTGKVDINSANVQELMAYLDGVGKKKAQAIIEFRKIKGPYKSMQDLLKVKGFSKKLLEKNKEKIEVLPIKN